MKRCLFSELSVVSRRWGTLLLVGLMPWIAEARFTDNGNGTVTDSESGLIWLKDADWLGEVTWEEGNSRVARLGASSHEGLSDRSRPGDWRLPTAHEMLTLTAAGLVGGHVPRDNPFDQFPGRARGVVYWTGTEGFYQPDQAFRVSLHGRAGIRTEPKTAKGRVWPVRGSSDQLPEHSGRVTVIENFDSLADREMERAELNALWDFTGLRLQDDFLVLHSDEFLIPPADLRERFSSKGYSIAKTAPTVLFQILPNLEPEYFPEGQAYQAGWANWGKITRSPDNRFFMAASDHRGRGSKINLYEFNPAEGEQGRLFRALDISEALGWHADMYTDGKVHGYMGLMPDGTLWAATHRGPEPTEEWYNDGYVGAWVFSYNIHTGEAVNHGNPLPRQELPSHVLDAERGIFLATGHLDTTLLAWDVNENKVHFAGSPPNGWRWHARSMFLDPDTGHFWSVDVSEEPHRFLSFDPATKEFKRHEVTLPVHPDSGETNPTRLHTTPKLEDGWYLNTMGSTLIRFKPDWENGPQVEVLGPAHGNTVQTALCPEQRYLYWVPRNNDGFLVMQYDVKNGTQKMLGNLKPYLLSNFGYDCGSGVYGISVSDCGGFLVVLDNGGFGRRFGGHPAVFVVQIPESERQLN